MSRFPASVLWILILALPGACFALGLGDIHVESTLRQPLVAQIELVDATHDDLASLSASIPDQATFQRYGLERPVFLSTAALQVSQDKQGLPVLALRSADAYAEPVVTFLVELHSSNGELIREYTVLLDPPGFAAEHGGVGSSAAAPILAAAPMSAVAQMSATSASVARAPAAPMAVATPTTTTVMPTSAPAATSKRPTAGAGLQQDPAISLSGRTYTVARRDTLARIVTKAGAHTRTARRQMMIAIFRANPGAFQSNLNMLRTGATLHFPNEAQLAAIPIAEADREFASQMAAWRASDHGTPAASVAAPIVAKRVADSIESARAASLEQAKRVQSLEKSLSDAQQDLKQQIAAETGAPVGTNVGHGLQPPQQRAPESVPTSGPAPVRAPESAPTSAPAPVRALESVPTSAPAPVRTPESAPTPARVQVRAPVVTPDQTEPTEEAAPIVHHRIPLGMLLGPLVACLALALAIGAWIYLRRRSIDYRPAQPFVAQAVSIRREVADDRPVQVSEPIQPGDVLAFQQTTVNTSYLVEETKAEPGPAKAPEPASGSATPGVDNEPTVKLPTAPPTHDAATTIVMLADVELSDDSVERELAFFNSDDDFNPESAANTTHVVMASGLNEAPAFVERRKNPVDVLRQAIEREPDRNDLRLKLLELYYTAAAQNRRAFLEITRQLAGNEKLATMPEWSQILDMGRAIAPDDELFSGGMDDQAVA